MYQRGAGNVFMLRERWNDTPFIHPMPSTLFQLCQRECSRQATWTIAHGPAMDRVRSLSSWSEHRPRLPHSSVDNNPRSSSSVQITVKGGWKTMSSCLQLPQPCPNNYVLLCASVNVLCPRWVMFRSWSPC